MSVDIFGRPSGENGSRGPPGPPGTRGSKGEGKGGFEQICKWLPDVALQGFKETQEACCFLLKKIQKKMLNRMVKKLRNGYHDHQKRKMLLQ